MRNFQYSTDLEQTALVFSSQKNFHLDFKRAKVALQKALRLTDFRLSDLIYFHLIVKYLFLFYFLINFDQVLIFINTNLAVSSCTVLVSLKLVHTNIKLISKPYNLRERSLKFSHALIQNLQRMMLHIEMSVQYSSLLYWLTRNQEFRNLAEREYLPLAQFC